MSSDLFSAEEAFVRLGQNRQKGCLVVFSKDEAAHVFVENGSVICALADKRFSEAALSHALHLEGASYSWMAGAEPTIKNLELSINQYALKHSIARDVKIGQTSPLTKTATKALPTEELPNKFAIKKLSLDYAYYFTDQEHPTIKRTVTKISNVVGRDEACDLVMTNPQVSRRHCIVQVTERGLLVKDLDSTNGTYVNGIAMTDGYVNRGDRLSLGSYELTIHIEKNRGSKVSYR